MAKIHSTLIDETVYHLEVEEDGETVNIYVPSYNRSLVTELVDYIKKYGLTTVNPTEIYEQTHAIVARAVELLPETKALLEEVNRLYTEYREIRGLITEDEEAYQRAVAIQNEVVSKVGAYIEKNGPIFEQLKKDAQQNWDALKKYLD